MKKAYDGKKTRTQKAQPYAAALFLLRISYCLSNCK